jgi:CheY-like chemotaxis protein
LADRIQSEIAQRRILCVDDNLLELTLLGRSLELQGSAVVLLSRSIQALRCDLSTFDLAILDFDMPGMNGKDIGRLPRSRYECDNPTRILTVGDKVQYVETADDSESAMRVRGTYRCTDEDDGTDLSEPSAAGQHFQLYRRALDSRDLLRLHGSVGALDEVSPAQKRHHGGRHTNHAHFT